MYQAKTRTFYDVDCMLTDGPSVHFANLNFRTNNRVTLNYVSAA